MPERNYVPYMSFSTKLVNTLFSGRRKEIDYFRRNPAEVQQKQLRMLVQNGSGTLLGMEFGLNPHMTAAEFSSQLPVFEYDTFKEYINRTRSGEKSVVWPGNTRWFAKSSGTTNDTSKFIPVTRDGLNDCHMRGPKDLVSMVCSLFPDTKAYDGKLLTLGGSRKLDPLGDHAQSGDLSAILIGNTPVWARGRRVPKPSTALIPDFEEKVRKIAEETVGRNITAFAGVPSWNLVMINKILEYTGKNHMLEVWPNLELFIHGGMSFEPYREQYLKVFPSPRMKYIETYNASEGFFAIQDDPLKSDMLLMLDYGMYYEFQPMDKLGDASAVVPLEGVEQGVNYAMIITNSNGLWRYMIGDTVMFTSLDPYRIKITGRTKLFINAFGEEIIIDNAERAIKAACEATGAQVLDYTAGPVYMGDRSNGAHEWIIEFSVEPDDLETFGRVLDETLRMVNSDYAAKRFKDTTLLKPQVRAVPRNTFYRWMAERGKLGGQNKVPRLANDRKYLDELLTLIANN